MLVSVVMLALAPCCLRLNGKPSKSFGFDLGTPASRASDVVTSSAGGISAVLSRVVMLAEAALCLTVNGKAIPAALGRFKSNSSAGALAITDSTMVGAMIVGVGVAKELPWV